MFVSAHVNRTVQGRMACFFGKSSQALHPNRESNRIGDENKWKLGLKGLTGDLIGLERDDC